MLPRFLLVLGHQLRGHMSPPWPGGGREERLAVQDGPWVAWRLVGSNHRELARSALVFPTASAAREGVAFMRAGIERASAVTEAARNLWGWQLSIDELPVAVASRLYQRPRECAYSLSAALAAIRVADLADTLPRAPRTQQREDASPAQLAAADMQPADMDTA